MHRFVQWKSALRTARTAGEVEQVIAQYVGGLAPGDKIGLPASCRNVLRDMDISMGAATLVREELGFDGDDATAELLHEIAHTFVAAANRIAFLANAR